MNIRRSSITFRGPANSPQNWFLDEEMKVDHSRYMQQLTASTFTQIRTLQKNTNIDWLVINNKKHYERNPALFTE